MNRTDRLLAIVLHIQSKGTLRAEDLAAHFETSKRTIYRDVQALCEAGVPVVATPGQGYTLSEGYFLPPLAFNADEAVMLLMGGQFMAQNFDAQYQAAAEAACLKIAGVLPERTRKDVNELQSSIRFFSGGGGDLSLLRSLRRAILERKTIRFRYHARNANEEREREADPHTLVYHDGAWHMGAYDHTREAMRSFRLDRIADVRVLPRTFTRRPEGKPEKHDPIRGRDIVVRVLFAAEDARWVKEAGNFFITSYEEVSEGLIVTLRVRQERDITGWLLGWGSKAQVLEPQSLRDLVCQEAERILARYQTTVSQLSAF